MHIVDVCAFYSPHGGGVRTYVEQKLRIGPRLGHQITILAPGDEAEVIERGPDARIVLLPSPRFPLDRKYWFFDDEPALHHALDLLAPDFVEASSPWRSASLVGRWRPHVPKALVMHADPLSAYAYRWLEPILSRASIDRQFEPFWNHLRTLGRQFDQVVCSSLDLADRLRAGGVAHVVTQPMGVEAGTFSPALRDPELRRAMLAHCDLPPDAALLIAAGRLAAEKRYPLIVEAVTLASRQRPIGLVILGEGREKRQLLKAIAGNPHIRLFEPVRDRRSFARLLASADALVHACEAETFCMVGAEARASGIPVIVPDRGGAADHGRGPGGYPYHAADSPAAARAILQALTSGRPAQLDQPRTMDDHFTDLLAGYSALALATPRAA